MYVCETPSPFLIFPKYFLLSPSYRFFWRVSYSAQSATRVRFCTPVVIFTRSARIGPNARVRGEGSEAEHGRKLCGVGAEGIRAKPVELLAQTDIFVLHMIVFLTVTVILACSTYI